jgi:hypothetical protein
MTRNGERAFLHAEDVPVIDTYVFLGTDVVPGTVSLRVRWDATGPAVDRGHGDSVPRDDPGAFLGEFAQARAVGQVSGSELGFSFKSNPGASSDEGYAQLGEERNGAFL